MIDDLILAEEAPAYQKLLLMVGDIKFKELKMCNSRAPGKSLFYKDNYEWWKRINRIEFDYSRKYYYIDPEILSEINTKELIKERKKNDALNKRRN